ncbi:MAG: BamA/TamA family outer membrane protein [Bacteroides sp.]|nr:BamA/TamA family outer membrane protein [Bacteroides sp.]
MRDFVKKHISGWCAAMFLTAFAPLCCPTARAQDVMSYSYVREYQVAGITVTGVSYLDPNALIHLSGLSVGKRIKVPGDATANAIDNLWKQGLFEDIKLTATNIEGDRIYLNIELTERPRLSGIVYEGVPKSIITKVDDEVKIKAGDILTDYKISQVEKKVREAFLDKSFYNAKIDFVKKADTANRNGVILLVKAEKNQRVKIQEIDFEGNTAVTPGGANLDFWKKVARGFRKVGNKENLAFSDKRLRRIMKSTKQVSPLRFWKKSKYIPGSLQEDFKLLVKAYNKEGFRDFRVLGDSLYTINDKRLGLKVKLYEGDPYYFGNITFVGNERYTSRQLSAVMNIQKGELYNEEKFTTNLMMNPNGADINSLYFDNGYLFCQTVPVETQVYNDTVDIEIRISEGVQARFNEIRVQGNTRTNDHVILRELRTVPGQLFSRTEIINSVNTLRQLRYFNDESIAPQPIPNMADGTTDLEFNLEEVGSDQLELSGGFGGGIVVGTIGLSFNNFSLRNLFKLDRWKPLPSGDGQQLSIRAQSNGTYYWSVATSFTEPWLGGKKPLAFSVSYNHSQQSNGLSKNDVNYGKLIVDGASVGLGQRLKWPDDFFTLYQSIGYERYRMRNYDMDNGVTDGVSNNFRYNLTIQRQNLDAAMFPTSGTSIALSFELTPPYTALGSKLYKSSNPEDHYKWLEYYKISLKAGWYFNPVAKLVVNARIRVGYLSYYTKKTGYPIFERFYLGGDGLTGFGLDGRELIGMRGYSNNSLSPTAGATAYDKITLELRYPFSTSPVATVYALAFFEAGNSWGKASDLNPFQVYKSAGVGVRLFLSSMGMFGLDWGYGFDEVPGNRSANGSHFHFSINQSLDW